MEKVKNIMKMVKLLLKVNEYINDKRNGKGKEYYENGKIMFKNKYLHGNKWGWKGYNNEGVYEYELNKGNGKVKYYDFHGILIFEGEIREGIKYDNNGNIIKEIYEEEYEDNGEEDYRDESF